MRRSRLDVRFGRELRLGQRWRRQSDGTVWGLRQVHQVDGLGLLERDDVRLYVSFRALRCEWELAGAPDPAAEQAGQLALTIGEGG